MSPTIRSKLAAWNTRLWFALSAPRRCHDIDVRIFLSGKERELLFEKVHAALSLISLYSAKRLQRIRGDLRGIWVTETAGNLAEYEHAVGLCLLDRTHLSQSDATPSHVAATIIHEATHARLRRAGFGYEPERRARIENVCYRAEIAFASRLPDGQAIVDQARRSLECDPVVWTATAAADRAMTKLRELGVPAWLIRFIIRKQPANDPLQRTGSTGR